MFLSLVIPIVGAKNESYKKKNNKKKPLFLVFIC